MKRTVLSFDVTDPNNPFLHKGWARKARTYLRVRLESHKSVCNGWYGWAFMIPEGDK